MKERMCAQEYEMMQRCRVGWEKKGEKEKISQIKMIYSKILSREENRLLIIYMHCVNLSCLFDYYYDS